MLPDVKFQKLKKYWASTAAHGPSILVDVATLFFSYALEQIHSLIYNHNLTSAKFYTGSLRHVYSQKKNKLRYGRGMDSIKHSVSFLFSASYTGDEFP